MVDAQKPALVNAGDNSSEKRSPDIKARVKYLLSEAGRRASLREGGDGRMEQTLEVIVPPADLDAFDVTQDGSVELDLAQPFDYFMGPALEATNSKAHWTDRDEDTNLQTLQWDIVPTREDIVEAGRQVKANDAEWAAETEKAANQEKEVIQRFFADPNARASAIERDYVVIEGHRFPKLEAAGMEATKRANSDQEAVKQANRVTLGEWIARHGSDNQRQRLLAGLLPMQEAYESVEHHLFQPLEGFPLHDRFDASKVCLCQPNDCVVKFQSVDGTEVTAQEWEQLAKIKATVPQAECRVREHRAYCESRTNPVIRRYVVVKFVMGGLSFKRQYALPDDSSWLTDADVRE